MTKSVAIIGTRGYPSYYGGFETAVRKIAPHLAESGWQVTVYGRDGATRDDDPARDARVVSTTTGGIESRSLSTLSYGFTAVLDALVHKPDVALVMNVANGFWLPLLRLRGIPTLVNVDGIEWERAKWGRLAKFVFRSGARTTAWFGTRLVGDAREIVRRWQADFGRRAVFIPYGGEEPGILPLESGLTHRGYALVVARFVPENTVAEFVEAARTIARSHDVVIVGSSGYGDELDEAVAELAATSPRVTWLGHLSDDRRLLALWQHAGAYFHGHSVGGTNPALVQAMLCGAPTVARDTVYNREVLGDSGVFVAPTPAAISEAVVDLLGDPVRQEALADAAQARAREHYTWADICRRYEAELTALVARGVRRRR
ncbi:glycosyltransferase [Frondihabitans cladoniiphilus]|uniref:Glycosyltransferase n=1 Tax=Frondihabitans cladoniiphilus TaxID=715785 RepID=A0ABP8W2S1_9MICO